MDVLCWSNSGRGERGRDAAVDGAKQSMDASKSRKLVK